MLSLDATVRTGNPAILVINGRGTVSVYPRQHCYVSDVQDWGGVYEASQDEISITPSTWSAPPAQSQPLEELQWRLAWHDALQERSAETKQALLHLQSWPNLTRLPEELIEPVARICALLWRKPTVSYLIPRVLELPADTAACAVRVLQMFGHVNRPQAADAAAPVESCFKPDAVAPPLPPAGIASRFFQRLLRLQAA